MREMTRIDDLEAARDWVTSRFEGGWPLPNVVLKTWDFAAGSVWTTVHESLGPHDGLDFVQGGKLAAVRKRGLVEPEELLGSFIHRRLGSEDELLVVEDHLRKKGDQLARELPGRTAYLDRQVYCFLPAGEASLPTIQDVLLKTFAPFLNVMILVSSDFGDVPRDGDEITPEILERAARAATTLIAGAYDEEAHVVWMKN